jgi:hypothetical protein
MRASLASMMLVMSERSMAWSVPFSPSPELTKTTEHQATIQFTMWALKAFAVIACITLLFAASKNLSAENYSQAILSFGGAVIAGGATFYALPLS